jgi:hypothetical protein
MNIAQLTSIGDRFSIVKGILFPWLIGQNPKQMLFVVSLSKGELYPRSAILQKNESTSS